MLNRCGRVRELAVAAPQWGTLQSMTAALPSKVMMTLDAVGGVWRYAMDLGAGLARRGIKVHFVGLGPQPSASQRAEAATVGGLDWLDAPLDWTTTGEADLDAVPPMLAAVATRAGADLLHLNLPSQAYGLRVEIPVVTVSHSCVVSWFRGVRNAPVWELWAWQERRNRGGFDSADAVVAPSHSHAELLRQAYGPIPNIQVVYNAVAEDGATPEPKEPLVFAAGRWWDEGKNGAVLDAAAPASPWPVLMAGPTYGPSGQSITLQHAQLLGEIPNAEVRTLMRRAAIVTAPSLYEPFGLAVLEAARAEAALVLADIPTFRELWDGAAEFADPHDPEAFAAAIEGLATDAARRAELGGAARERSLRFTPEAQATAMLEVYAQAARSASVRPALQLA